MVAPFPDEASRLALAKAGIELSAQTFGEISAALPSLGIPLRVVYGEQDRLLPDVGPPSGDMRRRRVVIH